METILLTGATFCSVFCLALCVGAKLFTRRRDDKLIAHVDFLDQWIGRDE